MENTNNYKAEQQTPKDFSYIGFGKVEISAFALIIITAVVGYFFVIKKIKRERHIKAYDIFYDSILPSIQILNKDIGTFKPENFESFRESFSAQDTARLRVIDTMRKRKITRFNKKWHEYKEWQDNCKTYQGTVITIGTQSSRESILKVINELLNIAKHY
jgi:hypothetical protein